MTADSDLMRAAAARMTVFAEHATPGPWTCYGDHLVWPSNNGPAANDPILAVIGEAHEDTKQHITLWDPTVARAVAEVLNAGAEEIDRRVARYGEQILERANPVLHAMTALARTFLDTPAEGEVVPAPRRLCDPEASR